MLNGTFWALQNLGLIKPGENPALIIGIYALVFLIYYILVAIYFRRNSAKNLEKLKKEVEEITGKKLTQL